MLVRLKDNLRGSLLDIGQVTALKLPLLLKLWDCWAVREQQAGGV